MTRTNQPRLVRLAAFAAAALTWTVAVAVVLATTGCQSGKTPVQQVVDANSAYTATLDVLNSAHRAGYLTTERKAQLEPYRAEVADSLDKAEAAALAGEDARSFLDVAQSALDVLLREQLRQKQIQDAVRNARRVQSTQPARRP